MEKNGFWKFISYVFHPIYMPTLAMVIVICTDRFIYLTVDAEGLWQMATVDIPVVFLCTAVIPLLFTWSLKLMGKISSLTEATREDRKWIILFSVLGFLLAYYVFRNAPLRAKSMNLLILGMNIGAIITFIANLFTKVSLHAAGVGGIVGTAIGLAYYTRFPLTFWIAGALLMAWLVTYARYKLKAHEPADICLGYCIGMVVQALVFFAGAR
jgi:hypothetical protein